MTSMLCLSFAWTQKPLHYSRSVSQVLHRPFRCHWIQQPWYFLAGQNEQGYGSDHCLLETSHGFSAPINQMGDAQLPEDSIYISKIETQILKSENIPNALEDRRLLQQMIAHCPPRYPPPIYPGPNANLALGVSCFVCLLLDRLQPSWRTRFQVYLSKVSSEIHECDWVLWQLSCWMSKIQKLRYIYSSRFWCRPYTTCWAYRCSWLGACRKAHRFGPLSSSVVWSDSTSSNRRWRSWYRRSTFWSNLLSAKWPETSTPDGLPSTSSS